MPRSTPSGQHLPILPDEILDILKPRPGQVIVDATLGYGGHSTLIYPHLQPRGRLFGFDIDREQLSLTAARMSDLGDGFEAIAGNFAGIVSPLAERGVLEVHGLLADLGMSSMQVDDPSRGFSFSRDGSLDMRMDRNRGETAAEFLQRIDQAALAQVLEEYGDEPQAEAIAKTIVRRRTEGPLTTTRQLAKLIEDEVPVRIIHGPNQPTPQQQRIRPIARVFQALRIVINRELSNLDALLRLAPGILAQGGVVAIMSFHSGEDRRVKAAFRDGLERGQYREISPDPIRASPSERYGNPRSRSAKLRWAKR